MLRWSLIRDLAWSLKIFVPFFIFVSISITQIIASKGRTGPNRNKMVCSPWQRILDCPRPFSGRLSSSSQLSSPFLQSIPSNLEDCNQKFTFKKRNQSFHGTIIIEKSEAFFAQVERGFDQYQYLPIENFENINTCRYV